MKNALSAPSVSAVCSTQKNVTNIPFLVKQKTRTAKKIFSVLLLIPRKKNGNAYVTVVVVSFFVLSVLLSLLTVTAASRRATSFYENSYGLYDLAAAGNEQVFFMLNEEFSRIGNEIFQKYFSYEREWEFFISFPETTDKFFAMTNISRRAHEEFYIETEIHKHDDDCLCWNANYTRVRSVVKILDDYALEMVELIRLTD
ncbi:MAG: hypothetical protein FWD19_00150 [Defluviitaleaceae bacterium]|nr:hypothetical protein [Defluviitaleaceae bacterium]